MMQTANVTGISSQLINGGTSSTILPSMQLNKSGGANESIIHSIDKRNHNNQGSSIRNGQIGAQTQNKSRFADQRNSADITSSKKRVMKDV